MSSPKIHHGAIDGAAEWDYHCGARVGGGFNTHREAVRSRRWRRHNPRAGPPLRQRQTAGFDPVQRIRANVQTLRHTPAPSLLRLAVVASTLPGQAT